MKKPALTIFFVISFLNVVFSQGLENGRQLFDDLLSSNWKVTFSDSGTENWENQWFLDGQRATIKNMSDGMLYSAGPIAYDNASHAVLWTRCSKYANIKISEIN